MIYNKKKIDFALKLTNYLEKLNLSNREFAILGDVDETQVSKWKKGAGIAPASIDKIAEHIKGFKEYILDDNDTILKDSDLLHNKSNISNVVDFQSHNDLNLIYVPLKAYGGFLNGYENRVFMDSLKHGYFPAIKGRCWAFEVEGFSMTPDFNPGDYVVCSELPSPDWLTKGREYVFQTIDGLCVKVFDKLANDLCHISSINPDYNPVTPLPIKSIKKIYYVEAMINKRK